MKRHPVNVNSWHYRLAKFWTTWPTANLCDYVRQVILGASALLFITTVLGGTFVFVVLGMTIPYIAYFLEGVPLFEFNSVLFAGFMVGHIITAVIVIGLAISKFIEWIKEDSHTSIPSEPNTFVLWWRNVKEKTCTPIDFVE